MNPNEMLKTSFNFFKFKNQSQHFKDLLNHFILPSLAIFACFGIMMPTAWGSVALGLIVPLWLLSGNYSDKASRIFKNHGLLFPIALFVLYGIGILYSSAPWGLRTTFALKYLKLLLIPAIALSVHSDHIRRYGINAFLIGVFLTLFVAYSKWLGWLPPHLGIHDHFMEYESHGYYLFKGSIAHGIIISFGMYMMLCKARFQSSTLLKVFWVGMACLAIFDVLYLGYGRTGQIILICLMLFFIYQHTEFKSLIYGLSLFIICIIFFLTSSFNLKTNFIPQKLAGTLEEITHHKKNDPNGLTSAGIRLEMYKNTITLIKKSIFYGYGTGALSTEYNKLIQNDDTTLRSVPNPHNQFLLTTFELGLIGLFLLLIMFLKQWELSRYLRDKDNNLTDYTKGLVITMCIGCLFNSLLLDANEGKFFCILMGLFLSAYKKRG